jgi:hypothetical protein
MARDKKASFKFSDIADAAGTIAQDATSDKLSTVATYSGSKAYVIASDVLAFWPETQAAASDFASQTDTPTAQALTTGALVGINAQNQDLFVKVVYRNGAAVSGAGSPTITIVGSSTRTVSATTNALTTGVVTLTAGRVLSTTSSASAVLYIPVMTSLPFLQLQINGTTSAATGATNTIQIVMASLVNARDGSVSY